MQYSSCFYLISFGIAIVILAKKKKYSDEHILLIFLMLGILTSFFDLLTYPITTFFMPYITYLVLIGYYDNNKNKIKHMMYSAFVWACGYGGMWCMKWIYASFLTDSNVIENAFDSIAAIAILVIIGIKSRDSIKSTTAMIFLMIFCAPFAWYCFASSHSYVHFWFTFRNLIITIWSLYAFLDIIEDKVKRNNYSY